MKLSLDEIYNIEAFLDLSSYYNFCMTSKFVYQTFYRKDVWLSLLRSRFPNYLPFLNDFSSQFNCRSKLRCWARRHKTTCLSRICTPSKFSPRYMHRLCERQSTLSNLTEYYIFGGEMMSTNGFRLLKDLWRINISEATMKITLEKQHIIFHPPTTSTTTFSSSSPSTLPSYSSYEMSLYLSDLFSGISACSINSLGGDLYIFGGFVYHNTNEERRHHNRVRQQNDENDSDDDDNDGVNIVMRSFSNRMWKLQLLTHDTTTTESHDYPMRHPEGSPHLSPQVLSSSSAETTYTGSSTWLASLYTPPTYPSHSTDNISSTSSNSTLPPIVLSHVPDTRWGHTVVTVNNTFLVLFGGSSPRGSFNDLWLFAPDIGWHEIKYQRHVHVPQDRDNTNSNSSSSSSSSRRGSSSGGGGGGGHVPTPRAGHSAVVVENYMYILGGNDTTISFNDMWKLSLDPICNYYHYLHQQVVYGNISSSHSTYSDIPLHIGDFTSDIWECLYNCMSVMGGPESCIGHTCTVVGDYLYIYGGRDFIRNEFREGVYIYDIQYHSWSKLEQVIQNDRSVTLRTGHSAVPCSSGIIYIGGLLSTGAVTNDILHLNIFGTYPLLSSINTSVSECYVSGESVCTSNTAEMSPGTHNDSDATTSMTSSPNLWNPVSSLTNYITNTFSSSASRRDTAEFWKSLTQTSKRHKNDLTYELEEIITD